MGQVMVINPDGSTYMQWAAAWQWQSSNENYLPPAAFVNPMQSMQALSPPQFITPAHHIMQQQAPQDQQLQQWLPWQGVKALPAPRRGFFGGLFK